MKNNIASSKKRKTNNLSMYLVYFVTIVLIVLFFELGIPSGSFLSLVEGNSMYPTLHSSQIIFAKDTKRNFERGDIVVAKLDQTKTKESEKTIIIIKRIIGIPGDEIEIRPEGLFVNQKMLTENYISEDIKAHTYRESEYNHAILESGEYYLLGDNREVSRDSRSWGAIRENDILYEQSEKITGRFWNVILMIVTLVVLLLYLQKYIMYLFECILKRREN